MFSSDQNRKDESLIPEALTAADMVKSRRAAGEGVGPTVNAQVFGASLMAKYDCWVHGEVICKWCKVMALHISGHSGRACVCVCLPSGGKWKIN